MAAVINNIVDESAVNKELDNLINRLGDVVKKIDTIAGKAISVKFDLAGTASITELTELIKKQDELIKNLSKAQKEHGDVSDKLAQKVLANELKKIEAREKAVDRSIAAMQKEQAARTAAIDKEQQAADKLTQRTLANELKKAEAADLYMRKMQEKADKLQKAADKEAANLAKSQEAYALLSKEYNEAARAAQNLGAQQFKLNQDIKNGVNVAFNTTELVKMAPALAMAKDKANGLHKALLEIDQTVGRSQRNVGNYNSATFAMSQILREAPSFAYSFSQGLLGISNNIPILVDEITRLKTANVELQAQGKATIPIWKQLAAAFTSPVGIITTVTALITIFAARMSMASHETKKAADAMSDYEGKLDNFRKTSEKLRADIAAESKFDLSKAKSEVDIMKDKNLTLDQRFLAYKRLMSIAPNIFDELDKEGFKTAENTKRMDEQIATMNRYIVLQAAISKGRADQQNALKLIEDNADLQDKKRADIQAERQRLLKGTPGGRVAVRPGRVDQFIKDVGDRTEVGRGAEDISKMQAELNKLIQEGNGLKNNEFNINKKLAEVERERASLQGDTKNPKTKEKKDNAKILEAELAAEKAAHDVKQELNQKSFLESRRTYTDELKLIEDQEQTADEHYANMQSIIIKYHGKVGESEFRFKQRLKEAYAEELKARNSAKEAIIRINDEIQKKDAENTKESIEYIRKLREQRDKIQKLLVDLDAQKESNAVKEKGVSFFSLILGNNGEAERQIQKLKEKTIELKKAIAEASIAQNALNEATHPTDGSAPSAIRIGDAQIKADEAAMKIEEARHNRQMALIEMQTSAKKKAADLTIQLVNETTNAIMEIERNKFRDEEFRLNKEGQQIKDNYEDKLRAINGEAGYQEDKAIKIQELNAQTQAQENKLNEEKKQLAIKQARFEKSAAEAAVIAKGAVGIADIWSKWAAVPIVAAALTAVQVGIIAAQISKIQSAPVPAYKDGTPEGGHGGGLAVIGDGGAPEYVQTPTGQSFWSKPTATLIDLPKGSTVTPLSKINKFQENLIGSSYSYSAKIDESNRFNEYKSMTDKLTQTFESGVENIVDSVIRSRANIVINQRDKNFEVNRLRQY